MEALKHHILSDFEHLTKVPNYALHTNLLEREKAIEAMNYPSEMSFSPCLVNGETARNNL